MCGRSSITGHVHCECRVAVRSVCNPRPQCEALSVDMLRHEDEDGEDEPELQPSPPRQRHGGENGYGRSRHPHDSAYANGRGEDDEVTVPMQSTTMRCASPQRFHRHWSHTCFPPVCQDRDQQGEGMPSAYGMSHQQTSVTQPQTLPSTRIAVVEGTLLLLENSSGGCRDHDGFYNENRVAALTLCRPESDMLNISLHALQAWHSDGNRHGGSAPQRRGPGARIDAAARANATLAHVHRLKPMAPGATARSRAGTLMPRGHTCTSPSLSCSRSRCEFVMSRGHPRTTTARMTGDDRGWMAAFAEHLYTRDCRAIRECD